MPIDPQDKEFLDAAERALSSAWDRYHAAPDSDKPLLQPQVEMAYQRWLDIRMKLLEPGTISTAEDVAEARRLRGEINAAADNQALVMALARLVALLTKFA